MAYIPEGLPFGAVCRGQDICQAPVGPKTPVGIRFDWNNHKEEWNGAAYIFTDTANPQEGPWGTNCGWAGEYTYAARLYTATPLWSFGRNRYYRIPDDQSFILAHDPDLQTCIDKTVASIPSLPEDLWMFSHGELWGHNWQLCEQILRKPLRDLIRLPTWFRAKHPLLAHSNVQKSPQPLPWNLPDNLFRTIVSFM